MLARLAHLSITISLVLIVCLPFLVPFEAFRNIELQAGLLIIAGGFAWLSVALNPQPVFKPYNRLSLWLIAVFAVCCILSAGLNPHLGYGLFGAPYIRLGALGLLACVGCGLILDCLRAVTWIKYLYVMIVMLGVLSVPYSLLKYHRLHRLVGLFAQSDLMAVFLGCGLLLGLYLFQTHPSRRKQIAAAQLLLLVLLGLTETRVVIVGVLALALLWQYQYQRRLLIRWWPVYLIGLVVLMAGLHWLAPNRLTSPGYASESVQYRLDLQAAALRASASKPLLGYGPGNLADALDCRKLTASDLLESCHHGYFFNSSHDIFIDRALALGWLGGLSYLAIVVLALYRGFRAKQEVRIIAYAALLISLYYLTNVTSVTLELLYWILLLRLLITTDEAV